MHDVAIIGKGAAFDAAQKEIERSGLHTVRLSEYSGTHPAAISDIPLELDDEIHQVVITDPDSEDEGRAAAHEVLAELFDDSEPGDEI